jgi:hypothetical protein
MLREPEPRRYLLTGAQGEDQIRKDRALALTSTRGPQSALLPRSLMVEHSLLHAERSGGRHRSSGASPGSETQDWPLS